MFDFGLRLRELRNNSNLSQEALGKKLERSKSVISNYENNIMMPPVDILTQMAVIFNVSLDYLVGIDKNEMISVEGLNEHQKSLIQQILYEMKDNRKVGVGLSKRQQDILNGLMIEFSRKNQG